MWSRSQEQPGKQMITQFGFRNFKAWQTFGRVDTDWADREAGLAQAGTTIHQLCPEDMAEMQARKRARSVA
jgi:hypothetical protein